MNKIEADKVGITNHTEPLAVWLDFFRWVAAVEVVLFHAMHRLFAPYGEVPHGSRSLGLYIVQGISGYGGAAVMIFFVLSGYLVGGGSLRRFRRTGQFDALDYSIARFSRLWIVILPGLLLTYLLNMIGAHIFEGLNTGVYELYGSKGNLVFRHDFATYACNAAFLQTAFCNQYGENGALWSLYNEFWYYVCWPLLMLAIWGSNNLQRIICAGAMILILGILTTNQQIGANLALYFLVWLAGVVAADLKRPFVRMHPLLGGTILVLFIVGARVIIKSDMGGDLGGKSSAHFITALLFTNLIMNMQERKVPYPPFRKIHGLIAGFAFSLYVLHTPILNCFSAILMSTTGNGYHMLPVGVLPFVWFGVAVLLCMVSSYLFSLVTENHTSDLRKRIMTRLRSQRQQSRQNS